MLVNRINKIMQDIIIPNANGGTEPLKIQCHQATLYWLYQEAFGADPEGDAYIFGSFNSSGPMMTAIAKLGSRLGKADFDRRNVAGGTVLIFADDTGDAKHSCVIRWDGNIGGYNQTDWFDTLGAKSDWSTHEPRDIPWRGAKVKLGNTPGAGNLIGVRGDKAVKYIRDNYKANV